jgi:hypothetical protein
MRVSEKRGMLQHTPLSISFCRKEFYKMVDWNQLIEIKLSNRNIKHLKDKGYDVDKYKIRKIHPSGVKSSRWCVPQGTTISIPLYDLSENSSYKIKIVCDYCGETFYSTFNSYKTRLKQSITKKDACKYCIPAKKNESLVFDKFEGVKPLFEEMNCTLLSEQEFVKSNDVLYYICNNHPDKIQYVRYHNIKRGQGICKECGYEKRSGTNHYNWNGGTSSLSEYLRHKINPWKYDSLKQYNFKCALSGSKSKSVIVHHLVSFSEIVKETLDSLSLDFKENISLYTEKELELISNKCLELHYQNGLGIPLLPSLHDAFHREYLYGKNTKEQFEEFRQRYLAGEFSDVV